MNMRNANLGAPGSFFTTYVKIPYHCLAIQLHFGFAWKFNFMFWKEFSLINLIFSFFFSPVSGDFNSLGAFLHQGKWSTV